MLIIPFKPRFLNKHVEKAINIIPKFLESNFLVHEIHELSKKRDLFEFSNVTVLESQSIIISNLGPGRIRVINIYAKFMWSFKAYASTVKNDITINTNKLNRYKDPRENIASISGTICHELIHVIDYYDPHRFGHNGNKSTGKQETMPYWYGATCEKFALLILEGKL